MMPMLRSLAFLLLLVPLHAASSSICPESPALSYASCLMTVTFDQKCKKVKQEMKARVSSKTWADPNAGKYTATSDTSTKLEASRKYNSGGMHQDLMAYSFDDIPGGGCKVRACSISQVNSFIDSSTNFCNLYNLYCNSDDGCPVVKHELTHKVSYDNCWQHAVGNCKSKKRAIDL